jgi:hypothetical protein
MGSVWRLEPPTGLLRDRSGRDSSHPASRGSTGYIDSFNARPRDKCLVQAGHACHRGCPGQDGWGPCVQEFIGCDSGQGLTVEALRDSRGFTGGGAPATSNPAQLAEHAEQGRSTCYKSLLNERKVWTDLFDAAYDQQQTGMNRLFGPTSSAQSDATHHQ